MWAMFLFLALFISDPDLSIDPLLELKGKIVLFMLPLVAAFVLTVVSEYKRHWSKGAKK